MQQEIRRVKVRPAAGAQYQEKSRVYSLRQFRKQLLAYVSANLAPTTAELYRAAITQFETLIGNFPLEDYSTPDG